MAMDKPEAKAVALAVTLVVMTVEEDEGAVERYEIIF